MSRIPTKGFSKALKEFYAFLKAAPNLINDYEAVTTNASARAANLNIYHTNITSGGTAGNEPYSLGTGTGVKVGQRKSVKLVTRTHASDVIVMDHANIVAADGTTAATGAILNAANEYALFEWTGAKWRALYSAAGVILTA